MDQIIQWNDIFLMSAMNFPPNLLQGEPPEVLAENSEFWINIIIGKSHLPSHSAGIPVYVQHLFIKFMYSEVFISVCYAKSQVEEGKMQQRLEIFKQTSYRPLADI